jgi:hypothetical protein
MKRNVAGQTVAAKLVSRTDGSPIAVGTVVVSITGDNGTRTTGSVGSGNAVHKGGGLWTYAPSQAETDFDHIAFDFDVATAVPVTVQVYTTFPQTGDSFARIGANGADLTSLASQSSVDAVPTAAENAAGLLDLTDGVETGLTVRQHHRLTAAVAYGKSTALGGTVTYRNTGDTKDRVEATANAGSRSAVTLDAT